MQTKVNSQKDLKQVRIIAKSGCYCIEVVYEKKEKEKIINNRYLEHFDFTF